MSQRSASSNATRPRVLVIYQRDDAEAQAQRLVQTLKRRFGDDVKTCYDFPPSELFSAESLTILIVLVGKKWPKLTGEWRLNPDAVRVNETLTSALLSALEIIPVFVGGAPMPSQADFFQPLKLRDSRWEQDVEKLVGRLERLGVPQSGSAAGKRVSDDVVKVNLRRGDAVTLVTALSLYLGSVPEAPRGMKKGGGKSRDKHQINRAQSATEYLHRIDFFGQLSFRHWLPELGTAIVSRGASVAQRANNTGEVKAADVVSCTVFSPPRVAPGATFLVQVFAHLPEEAAEASQLAKQAVKESEKLSSKTLDSEVKRGTKLSFDLSLPGLLIDEPSQHLTWRGRPEAVQFGVTVQGTEQPGNVIGTVRVSQNDVPFGHVKFQLTVVADDAAAPAPQPQATRDWVKYKKAFISYASKDRNEVLKRAQMLARLTPDFFLDLLTLEPGERWEKGLYKQIDESDVFFLFWSTAAKQSKWVMKEVDYALARKGKDESAPPEIIPMVIEGPPPVKPPRRLSHLHFNDMFLYFMAQPEKKVGSKKKGQPRTRRQP